MVIEINNLSYSINKKQILKNITLKVEKGAICGLIGNNGVGKTTLIKIILGILKPRNGTIFIDESLIDIGLQNIGSLIENASIYDHLTGWQNLKVASLLHSNISESYIGELLEKCNLFNDRNKLASQYSLGMRQRLGIALALIGKPNLVILDEPTNGLDPSGINDLRNIILNLNKAYLTTFLISSHLIAEIEKFITQIVILKDGQVFLDQPMVNLKEKLSNVIFETDIIDFENVNIFFENLKPEINGSFIIYKITDKITIPKIVEFLTLNKIQVFSINYNSTTLEELFLNTNKIC